MTTETKTEARRPEVVSIGVTNSGKAIVRLVVNGRRLDIDTNTVSFARLAAEGVRVEKGGSAI